MGPSDAKKAPSAVALHLMFLSVRSSSDLIFVAFDNFFCALRLSLQREMRSIG